MSNDRLVKERQSGRQRVWGYTDKTLHIEPTVGQRLVGARYAEIGLEGDVACCALQIQKGVTAYFSSKQLLTFAFAEQYSGTYVFTWPTVLRSPSQ